MPNTSANSPLRRGDFIHHNEYLKSSVHDVDAALCIARMLEGLTAPPLNSMTSSLGAQTPETETSLRSDTIATEPSGPTSPISRSWRVSARPDAPRLATLFDRTRFALVREETVKFSLGEREGGRVE